MNPFQLSLASWRCFLVPGWLGEALGRSHLADPRLDSHEFIASADVDFRKFIVIAEVTHSSAFYLFDLGSYLPLFLLLTLRFGCLTASLGS